MKPQSLFKAFVHAGSGIAWFFTHDRNGKIHLVAAVLVTLIGYQLQLAIAEWEVLLLCFALVISMEMVNHAIEKLADVAHPERHPLIKTAKDVAAAAVLWSTIMAVIIGALIFLPKLEILL
jgi:diacylglycerol kinase